MYCENFTLARIIKKKKKKNHIGEIGWAGSKSWRGGEEWENWRESDGKLNVDVFFTLGGILVILIIR